MNLLAVSNRLDIFKPSMRRKITINEAAAAMGRKGGRASGPVKSRPGTSKQILQWWDSPAGLLHRSKKVRNSEIKTITHIEYDCTKNTKNH